MRDALSKQEREILLSICVWGFADVGKWFALLPTFVNMPLTDL